MKGDGGAAFPTDSFWQGMSLRDYFAAQALVALGDHKAVEARGIPWLAEHAYMVADALMEARKP